MGTRLRLWPTSLVRRTRFEGDLTDELEFHIQTRAAQWEAQGLTPAEARRRARIEFGSVDKVTEQVRDVRRGIWVDNARKDVIVAARRLMRSPVFTLVSVGTLALAIAANASIFAVVERVVLNPLPYAESGRLIALEHGAPVIDVPSGLGMTAGLYQHYRERARGLEALALHDTQELTLTGNGNPERIRVTRATVSLASVLRVAPARGRWFRDEEGAPGAASVAVLSHGLWMRRYNGDPDVLGRTVTIDGTASEVVGVMPASFGFPDPRVDVWLPEPVTRAMGFGIWDYDGVARLREGASLAGIRAELNGLIADVPQAFPGDPLASGNSTAIGLTSTPRTLIDATIGDVGRTLWILLASVGLVLLVAFANIANLFLVRSDARQREVAIRRALGAGQGGIGRLFLAESALLSMAAGVLGLSLAWAAVRLLVVFGPPALPRLQEVQLNGVTVAFTLVLSMLAALAFCTIPLLRGARIAASLHEEGRGNTAGRTRQRARHVLMAGQVALALVLLVSSALMIRSFQNLRRIDPNFDASSVLTFGIAVPDREYDTRAAAVAAHHAILDRLSALPGAAAVSASTCLPLTGACFGTTVLVEGRELPDDTVPPVAYFRAVAGGYFETMGIRILRGRGLERGDVDSNESVIVVDEAFVERFFPNEDPIGRRVGSNLPPARPAEPPELTWLTIVGVVSNAPVRVLGDSAVWPQLYMPMSIAGGPDVHVLMGPDVTVMSYVVRLTTSPASFLPFARRAIDEVDANLALAQVRTLQDVLDEASAQMRFTMTLLAIAAGVALMLSLVGIYGVVSYIVSQRTNEIGVRLTLGAEPASVAGMIVRQGGVVTLVGVAVGLAAAVAGSRFLESLLYGVGPRDPITFAATGIVLLVVALLACWLPARRAARMNPLDALRIN